MSNGFLLDTNVPSEFGKPLPDPRVNAWVAAQLDLNLSVISIGELRKGTSLLPPGKRRTELETWFDRFLPLLAGNIMPVTRPIADRWGIITAERQRRGAPLSAADGLIAATALEHDLTLVTRNVKDFQDLGLSLINPWEQ